MTRVAMCRWCGEPLVSSMAFSGFEFICVNCGRSETFFGPRPADETPELLAKVEANKEKWRAVSDGLLSGGVMLTACREAGGKCLGEPHLLHATDEEVAAHEAAMKRVRELRAAS